MEPEPHLTNNVTGASVTAVAQLPSFEFSQWRPLPLRAPRLGTRIRRLPWQFVKAFGVIATVVALLAWLSYQFHLFVLGGFFGVFATLWRLISFHRAPESITELMDFPSSILQFPVSATYLDGKRPTGHDVGVVTFVDDLLHFEGLRTSFDLPSEAVDITYPGSKKKFGRLQTSHGPFVLTYNFRCATGEVYFYTYGHVPGQRQDLTVAFAQAMRTWSSTPGGPYQKICLPPDCPDLEITWWSLVHRPLDEPIRALLRHLFRRRARRSEASQHTH